MALPATHEHWSSRLAFLLAAIGAAVGIGNIWKFPYLAGSNGGSAFVLVYLLCVALVAIPILIAEILLGRMGGLSPPRTMARLARRFGRHPAWAAIGWLGMLAAYLIATYYSVIAGWTLVYVFKNGGGNFVGQLAPAVSGEFDALLADPLQLTLWHGVFMVATALILMRGLKRGIERCVKILMPLLFALLLVLVGYSAVAGDLASGLHYLFDFELSAVDGGVILTAMGQAFFSIGVAMGLMMGFGAYLDQGISIAHSAVIIALADTAVALLAGIAIFPIVFAHGLDPAEGPGLVFVSLPLAFGHMPGGLVFGTLFFLLLFFAALTSAIGVLEPMVAWVTEATPLRRSAAAASVCASIFLLGLCTVFSFNLWSGWYPLGFIERFAGSTYFDLLDYLTANVMMPLGGLLLALFAGWRISRADLGAGLRMQNPRLFQAWLWLLRWLGPLSIFAIFAANL
jgi:NSS family neurotransmitter:Na+ symporter